MQEINFSENDIDAIYKYLALTIDSMKTEDIELWLGILDKIDPDYKNYEDDEIDDDPEP